ncbi:FAD-binding oxidoreductase [Salarchaeum sp. III]|uniref:FAD-binding oxidoreductase n=1 Tax=Salarchaeum sp. III TaxID=3107927 RepID=UPI002ED9E311
MTDHDASFLRDLDAECSFTESHREQYARDASPHHPSTPDAVVWPERTEEVSNVLSAAYEREVPVTPWSGGSGLEGNAIPVEGGIVLSTKEMTWVDADPDTLTARVGPGVVYDDLNETLAGDGLRFPPGISSGDVATIGGMIATNASGFNAVRYGETRDHVRRIEAVLPDGERVQAGRNVVKTSSGYSIKDLLVGSEGTLGVVTDATIELAGIPAEKRAALVAFESARDACRAVSDIIGAGVKPGAIEFMDEQSIELLNENRDDLTLPERATLLLELHGNTSGIDEDYAFVEGLCREHGVVEWTEPGGAMADVWEARREALPAARAYDPDLDVAVIGDVVVPITNYPDIVERAHELADEYDLLVPLVGHAGDGNLHYTPLVDRDDEDHVIRAMAYNNEVVQAAIDMDGTATGEHGVGIGKRGFMDDEHANTVDVMRSVKDAIDPKGLLNPGKVIPEE